MPRLARILLAILPVLVAGCADARPQAPSLTRPVIPHQFRTLSYPQQGLSISVPEGWILPRTHRPLVTLAASGNAVIALWRYRRSGPVPADASSLTLSRRALVAAVRAREPGLQVLGSRAILVDRRPAIVLDTLARISGLLRQVRSVHVYAPGEEVVLEEYAPTSVFALLSHSVFVPVRRSLHITTF